MHASRSISPRDVDRAAPLLAALWRDGVVTISASWWKHVLIGIGSLAFLAFGVLGLVPSIRIMLGLQEAGIGRFGMEQSWLAGVLFFPLPILLGLAGVVAVIVMAARPARVTVSAAGIELTRGSRVDAVIPWHAVTQMRLERSTHKLVVTSTTASIEWRREGVPWLTSVPPSMSERPGTIAALIERARRPADLDHR